MTDQSARHAALNPVLPLPGDRPVIAQVVRNGFVEGQHHGVVVGLAADGSVALARGDVDQVILPRSCNKPFQTVAMLRAGLDLPPDLLALATASHSGEPFHLAGVRRILATAGLGEELLQTPADLPFDERVKEEYLASGGRREPIVMNCSGKHAAMLLTCVRNGWPVETYREPEHPLQRLVGETFADLTGGAAAVEAVDGCGLPLLGTSVRALARAFARLATAEADTEEGRVAAAMRAHPEMVSGTTRPERTLHQAIPGLVGKIGAEAVLVVATADGRAIALKVDDGAGRVPAVVMAGALERMGMLAPAGVDVEAVRAAGTVLLTGGPEVVGALSATL